MVCGLAAWASTLDVAVRQEHAGLGVVGLTNGATRDVPRSIQRLKDLLGARPVLWRVSAVEMVEVDAESGEVGGMLRAYAGDEFLGRDALGLRPQHDGRAVRVVGANVVALVACQFLVAHPNIGLRVLHQMPQMQWAVGVGEGTGDENAAHGRPRSKTVIRHYAKAGATPGRLSHAGQVPHFHEEPAAVRRRVGSGGAGWAPRPSAGGKGIQFLASRWGLLRMGKLELGTWRRLQ